MPKVNKYPCKNGFSKIYEQLLGGEWWAEWPFHHTRKWRFDYACPELKIAIEVDGGIFTGGRHSGGVGQLKDMEKGNHACADNWLVFHTSPADMHDLALRKLILQAIELRKTQKS